MSMEARRLGSAAPLPLTSREQLREAREVMRLEAVSLWKLSDQIGESFVQATELIFNVRGSVIVTGMGKAGLIGQKIVATLASTGTSSHFLHPAEAFHGDLGRVQSGDVLVMLSQSGETGEVVQLLPSLREFKIPIIAITASQFSTVGRAAATTIELGELTEACSLGLAPSTSTTAMLALGDALALVVSKMHGFQPEDFARFHPGGSLGRRLSKVEDHMRPLTECRVAEDHLTVRQVLVGCSKPGRRSGAIMLVDQAGKFTGMFTDSDLARLFEQHSENLLDKPMREVMAQSPSSILVGSKLEQAVQILANRKFSELPVVSRTGEPLGMIDVTDMIELSAQPAANEASPEVTGPTTVRIFPPTSNEPSEE